MKKDVKKNDLIKFNYIFDPKEKYYGLVCEVISDYNFEVMLNILKENTVEMTPISIIYIEENHRNERR